MVVMMVACIKEIGIGRVHPPGIDVVVDELLQTFPIDFACFGTECIIYPYAARIISAWRPDVRKTALRPCLEIVEQSLFLKLLEGMCLRTETCPDTDHQVSVLTMHFVYHLLAAMIRFAQEIHGVPQIVVTPILPVLNDTVEGYSVGTVPMHHFEQFFRCLVAFAALPIAEGPKWEHGYLSTQGTHLCVQFVARISEHEVIVYFIAYFGREGHPIGIVDKIGTRIVVPEKSPTLQRLDHILIIL